LLWLDVDDKSNDVQVQECTTHMSELCSRRSIFRGAFLSSLLGYITRLIEEYKSLVVTDLIGCFCLVFALLY
jgi:hypothetical protein